MGRIREERQQRTVIALLVMGLLAMGLYGLYDYVGFGGLVLGIAGIAVVIFLALLFDPNYEKVMEARREVRREQDSKLVCPHCQTKGKVRTREVTVKAGMGTAEATAAAILTDGWSLLNSEREEKMTQATCSNCGVTWRL